MARWRTNALLCYYRPAVCVVKDPGWAAAPGGQCGQDPAGRCHPGRGSRRGREERRR